MFISFEGIEGSGKSTLMKSIRSWCGEKGIDGVFTKEPGGSELGVEIRSILTHVETKLDSRAELLLFLADRAQHMSSLIKPALHNGQWVFTDRFADSTIAYQGYGRGLNIKELMQLNNFALQGKWPDKTFLIDLDPELGLRRARGRNHKLGISQSEGRFEAEDLLFHNKVRQGFLECAQRSPDRFVVVDGRLSPEKIFFEVVAVLESYIKNF